MAIKATKTATMICLHLAVATSVAYVLTGSLAISGMVALVEPFANVAAVHVHEKVWSAVMSRWGGASPA